MKAGGRMGLHPCVECGVQQCGEDFECPACGFGSAANGDSLCAGCAEEHPCGQSGVSCCCYCCRETFQCCGKVLCGHGNFRSFDTYAKMQEACYVKLRKEPCIFAHVPKTLPCGHLGCNFSGDTCFTCGQQLAAGGPAAASMSLSGPGPAICRAGAEPPAPGAHPCAAAGGAGSKRKGGAEERGAKKRKEKPAPAEKRLSRFRAHPNQVGSMLHAVLRRAGWRALITDD